MVFKKMMRAFGAGGPSVDTVLANPNTRPGLDLTGEVQVTGGDHEVTVQLITLSLVSQTEHGPVEFHRFAVAQEFRLAAGERRGLPFALPVPWETPVTHLYGDRLRGMVLGVRTEVAVAKAVDKGDLDEVAVHPLPAQERILEAFGRLGFRFAKADLEHGRIHGVHQTLPFYQEIEFYPPPQYAGAINEVEVTFVADPEGVEVILEFDKRGGFLSEGHDAYGRYRVQHVDADSVDWTAVVAGWVDEAAGRYQSLRSSSGHGFSSGPGFSSGHGYSHGPGQGYGHGYSHGSGHGHGHGPGMGAMAAGVAGGVVGGMVLGEVVEEVFEDDSEEFEE